MKTVGEIIKEKRLELGLSQRKMAEELGVTSATISHWEHDINTPNILLAWDIADYFGCSLDELCGREYGGPENG